MPESTVPVIDLAPLRAGDERATATAIDAACREVGFFTLVGHGLDPGLRVRLDALAREFFALPEAEKAEISMARGGRAWRGWFPVDGELTSGVPDRKEGIYFGEELGPDDPRVAAGHPMHGANLFPRRPPELRDAVLAYMAAVTDVGQLVLRAMALGLGLPPTWFSAHLTHDPLVLFRIFHYPPLPPESSQWSVGEHTDYGLVTLLGQDGQPGLEVRGPDGWVPVTTGADALVVNIGDMLERVTGGAYRSTPHRVRNGPGTDRLSYPLFLDPGWDVEVRPVPLAGVGAHAARDDGSTRWDGRSVHEGDGTYGDYVFSKVGKVFPALFDAVDTVDTRSD